MKHWIAKKCIHITNMKVRKHRMFQYPEAICDLTAI